MLESIPNWLDSLLLSRYKFITPTLYITPFLAFIREKSSLKSINFDHFQPNSLPKISRQIKELHQVLSEPIKDPESILLDLYYLMSNLLALFPKLYVRLISPLTF